MLQSSPTNTALKELKSLIPLIVRKSIKNQRNTGPVKHFYPRHIDLPLARISNIERKKIQVVINIPGIPVVFGIASNDRMMSSIEHGPRGSRKANPASVEILK